MLNDTFKMVDIFFAKAFNWASVRTMSEYNNIGDNNKDGVLYYMMW